MFPLLHKAFPNFLARSYFSFKPLMCSVSLSQHIDSALSQNHLYFLLIDLSKYKQLTIRAEFINPGLIKIPIQIGNSNTCWTELFT